MLEGYSEDEVRHAVYDLAEAAIAVIGESRLVHAAALRAIETRKKVDAERFLRHLARLDGIDRISISRKRDAMLFERWTRVTFGAATLREGEP